MYFSTAFEWITWMSSLHVSDIELGLDRIKVVASRLALLTPECPVIIVGGTNGKGSTVAGLESIYRQAGYKVGAFTSPMLFKPNEQIRIDGQEVSDNELCSAFEEVATALHETTLTQFEFFTLAALVVFKRHPLDVMILEVGLGGRLDAVNIIDADMAVVTSISIDHVEWLGDTREKIGFEKAGIFRAGKPAVCGDPNPPQSLIDYAGKINAPFFCQGKEFNYQENENSWTWCCFELNPHPSPLPQSRSAILTNNIRAGEGFPSDSKLEFDDSKRDVLESKREFKADIVTDSLSRSQGDDHDHKSLLRERVRVRERPTTTLHELPLTTLATQNMSTVLMAITLLQSTLPVIENAIKIGLKNVSLRGRIQIIPGEITKIFDVSHNPASIAMLAEKLPRKGGAVKTLAVFSMLADKDIAESLQVIKNKIDHWYVAPLNIKRAASKEQLAAAFKQADIQTVTFFFDITSAYKEALQQAKTGDSVLVFGSFHVVSNTIS